jgi:hypothetical protein
MPHYLQLLGLIVGFVGAVLLTCSQREGAISHSTDKGKATYLILAHPRWWEWGLYLLSAGFVIQFIGALL